MTRLKTINLGRDCAVTSLPGGRLQLQQGPINIVVKAYGHERAVNSAYAKAIDYFPNILQRLVANLDVLKRPLKAETQLHDCATSTKMVNAASPYQDRFVTPMACVAGAVADDVVSVMAPTPGIEKIFANNGGDIALYLSARKSISIGVVPSLVDAVREGKMVIHHDDHIGGIATSGWCGTSYSMGIADAVTVLARNAADADIAATLIANEVNIDSTVIKRARAIDLDDTSDLGERLVTTAVGPLSLDKKRAALAAGVCYAQKLIDQKMITAALLNVQGEWAVTGDTKFKVRETITNQITTGK